MMRYRSFKSFHYFNGWAFSLDYVEVKVELRNIAKLSSSSVPVQSNLNRDLALNLVITTTTPTPPRESRDTAISGLPKALKFGMEALFNQTKSTSKLASHQLPASLPDMLWQAM